MATYVLPDVFTAAERDAAWADLTHAEAYALTYLLAEHFPAVWDDLIERVPSRRLHIIKEPTA